jgi:hypothetical protein
MAEGSELVALVQRHLKANKNDRARTLRSAVDELMADSAALERVLTEVVAEAVDQHVRHALTAQRHRATARAAMLATEGAKAAAKSAMDGLMRFPMMSGTRLGDALKPEVSDTARRYVTSGSVQVQRGIWLRSVAASLPDDTTPVRKALGPDDLSRLLDDAVERVRRMGIDHGD